jgi:hypothetical protein
MPVKEFNEREFFGGTYVRGSDFVGGAERFKIIDVQEGEYQGNPTLELIFHDGRKASVRARNYKRLKEKFGGDPNDWIGKVVICDAGDDYNGKPALLIKPFILKQAAPLPSEVDEDVPF